MTLSNFAMTDEQGICAWGRYVSLPKKMTAELAAGGGAFA
jgi:hypothetical protein